jgi:hypothetical protein
MKTSEIGLTHSLRFTNAKLGRRLIAKTMWLAESVRNETNFEAKKRSAIILKCGEGSLRLAF